MTFICGIHTLCPSPALTFSLNLVADNANLEFCETFKKLGTYSTVKYKLRITTYRLFLNTVLYCKI